jgi:hypothetical protein
MAKVPSEVWFPGRPISDYKNCKMEICLTEPQQEVIRSFFRALINTRASIEISVPKFMLAYRKERNGRLFSKIGR